MADFKRDRLSTPEPRSPLWGRRRFLATVLGGAAALVLQACGREDRVIPPEPTSAPPVPTPGGSVTVEPAPTQRSYLPFIANEAGSPASPTAVEPTETATPRPGTPVPTSTPRPTPTPFPPGPPSKLGLFVGYNHPQLFDLLSTGNVALVK